MMSKYKNRYYAETLEEAKSILDEYQLKYEYKNYALYIQDPVDENQSYDYRYTTSRWASLRYRRNNLRKHYYCKGTRDLIERFILKNDKKRIDKQLQKTYTVATPQLNSKEYKGMTQVQLIKNHLDSGKGISHYEAMNLYRIASLSRRINDLEEQGYEVKRDRKKDLTGRTYVRYTKAA